MVLRVKLEIVPFGDEDKAYEIGRLDIFNKGRLPEAINDVWCGYGVIDLTPKQTGLHTKEVLHNRIDGAWTLLRRTLNELKLKGP